MKTHDKNTEEEKSLSGKKEDVKEQMGNFLEEKETAPEDEGAKDDPHETRCSSYSWCYCL